MAEPTELETKVEARRKHAIDIGLPRIVISIEKLLDKEHEGWAYSGSGIIVRGRDAPTNLVRVTPRRYSIESDKKIVYEQIGELIVPVIVGYIPGKWEASLNLLHHELSGKKYNSIKANGGDPGVLSQDYRDKLLRERFNL